jgi:hypothetical protein
MNSYDLSLLMNPPPLFIQDKLLDGFFIGILIGLVSQPIGLPGTFQTTIAMGIINPVVDKATTPTMECTLVFGNGQTNRLLSEPLNRHR